MQSMVRQIKGNVVLQFTEAPFNQIYWSIIDSAVWSCQSIQYLFLLSLCFFGSWSAAAQNQFRDISMQVEIIHHAVDEQLRIAGGVVPFDLDNDGLPDLYFTGGNTMDLLLRNVGGFKFEDISESIGISDFEWESSGVNSADLNNDGWADLFITTLEGYSNVVLINNRNGTFSDKTTEFGFDTGEYWGTSVTFADFNNDGILDVYVGNYADYDDVGLIRERIRPFPNQLFMSTGEFLWEEVAVLKGVEGYAYTLVVSAEDFDLDGDMDIYVGNDFGLFGRKLANKYYENQGDGNFLEQSESGLEINMFAMGIDAADFDLDGDLDLYLSDLEKNKFLENRAGQYHDITDEIYAFGDYVSWGATFFDSNNNGFDDIFIVNGEITGHSYQPLQYYKYYEGVYVGTNMRAFDDPFYGRGSAIADFDNDGDKDVIVHPTSEVSTNQPELVRVFQNNNENKNPDHGWIDIDLQGVDVNKNGIGSIIKLNLADGQTILKTVSNGGAYLSGREISTHFGFGAKAIVSLEVCWPNRSCDLFYNVPSRSRISINEKTGITAVHNHIVTGVAGSIYPNFNIWVHNKELYMEGLQSGQRVEIECVSMQGHQMDVSFMPNNGPSATFPIEKFNLPGGLYLLAVVQGSQRRFVKFYN
jgi:hypothetical protein